MKNNIKELIMIYFGLALFCTGVFIVQFILSIIFGEIDTDIDIDGDGSSDFDISSLISFKGLIHFGIGFSWNMWLSRENEDKLTALLISIAIGISFMFILATVYKLSLKLEKKIKPESKTDLVGRSCEIYYRGPGDDEWKVFITINGSSRVISSISESGKDYESGELTEVIDYREGNYIIP